MAYDGIVQFLTEISACMMRDYLGHIEQGVQEEFVGAHLAARWAVRKSLQGHAGVPDGP